MSVAILVGDCREILKTIASDSVHCVVTSPPYWRLRDYGVANQVGQEASPEKFVTELVEIFREVRRVLRPDGSLWLNLGDSYVSSGGTHDGRSDNQPGVGANQVWRNGSGRADGIVDGRGQRNRNGNTVSNMKPKDLVGIPWRVALALQADGWWLRQDIIWSKPNPMPESVQDRCTKAHEYIFMLTKSAKYYYDADAIAEDAIYSGVTGQDASGYKNAANFSGKNSGGNLVRGEKPDKQRGHGRRHDGFNDRWDKMEKAEQCSGKRNKRSVWNVATKPFPEAHFATFPPELIQPCVLAGCPKGGLVLDPFGGAGTTGLVADRNERSAMLIELNPEYAAMAEKRLQGDGGMFASVAVTRQTPSPP